MDDLTFRAPWIDATAEKKILQRKHIAAADCRGAPSLMPRSEWRTASGISPVIKVFLGFLTQYSAQYTMKLVHLSRNRFSTLSAWRVLLHRFDVLIIHLIMANHSGFDSRDIRIQFPVPSLWTSWNGYSFGHVVTRLLLSTVSGRHTAVESPMPHDIPRPLTHCCSCQNET